VTVIVGVAELVKLTVGDGVRVGCTELVIVGVGVGVLVSVGVGVADSDVDADGVALTDTLPVTLGETVGVGVALTTNELETLIVGVIEGVELIVGVGL
jgi:hypothetical protein